MQTFFSPHALVRMRQRGIDPRQIDTILDWGLEFPQRNGRVAYLFGRRQARRAALPGWLARRLAGTVVVLASDGTVVTAIRTGSTRRLRRWNR